MYRACSENDMWSHVAGAVNVARVGDKPEKITKSQSSDPCAPGLQEPACGGAIY